LNNLPPDIRKQYDAVGGALEHYQEVMKDNPAFPMARYFTGNVHNDRGSEYFGQALEARRKGDMSEANRLKDRALEEWDLCEKAYESTKELAPNYVQTHHQLGLLYVKRAELAREWGDQAKMKEYYQKALHHFMLYKMLDPVFPPNYDRIVQILLMDGKYDECIKLYKEAIHYNGEVARAINVFGYPERVCDMSVSLARVYMSQANSIAPDPFHPKLKQIDEAISVLEDGVKLFPKNIDAWKLLGLLHERSGEAAKAQEAYRKALELNPKDPDLKRAAG
jgi:tetratricopeptide (TPR) repeat protein